MLIDLVIENQVWASSSESKYKSMSSRCQSWTYANRFLQNFLLSIQLVAFEGGGGHYFFQQSQDYLIQAATFWKELGPQGSNNSRVITYKT